MFGLTYRDLFLGSSFVSTTVHVPLSFLLSRCLPFVTYYPVFPHEYLLRTDEGAWNLVLGARMQAI